MGVLDASAEPPVAAVLILNADDFGRSRAETDAALTCFGAGRISSATAMVFMADSERAAELARARSLPIGLHLNLVEPMNGRGPSASTLRHHEKVRRFLGRSRYSVLCYNPLLRESVRCVYLSQAEEFIRLYGKSPSHVDGHHHMHLWLNVLLGGLVPKRTAMRRNLTFRPGEKSPWNRACRTFTDGLLALRHRVTDHFFDLSMLIKADQVGSTMELARGSSVEVMTHPVRREESEWLLSETARRALARVALAGYESL